MTPRKRWSEKNREERRDELIRGLVGGIVGGFLGAAFVVLVLHFIYGGW